MNKYVPIWDSISTYLIYECVFQIQWIFNYLGYHRSEDRGSHCESLINITDKLSALETMTLKLY